jgi:hypothetical protein
MQVFVQYAGSNDGAERMTIDYTGMSIDLRSAVSVSTKQEVQGIKTAYETKYSTLRLRHLRLSRL